MTLLITSPRAKSAQNSPSTDSQVVPTTHSTTQLSTPVGNNITYGKVTKGKASSDLMQVVNLLTELLSAITSDEDPKTIMISLIQSFIKLLSSQNE